MVLLWRASGRAPLVAIFLKFKIVRTIVLLNIIIFLTFVAFAKTRVIMRFCSKNEDTAQGYLKCVPPHGGYPVVRTDERT